MISQGSGWKTKTLTTELRFERRRNFISLGRYSNREASGLEMMCGTATFVWNRVSNVQKTSRVFGVYFWENDVNNSHCLGEFIVNQSILPINFTPPKTNMEPTNLWFGSMFLLFQGGIFRFQPFVFRGVVKTWCPAWMDSKGLFTLKFQGGGSHLCPVILGALTWW